MNNNISFCLNNKVQVRRDQARQSNNDRANLSKKNSLSKDSFDNKLSKKNVKFGAGFSPVDAITKSMKSIEKGGKMAEFIVLDVASMVIPRTVLGFLRNHKELGHLNYQAGKEEAIRETLTGPSMFLIPMGFLAASKMVGGKATGIRFDEMDRFKSSFKSTADNLKDGNKPFFKQVFQDCLNENFKDKENFKANQELLAYVHKDKASGSLVATQKTIEKHSEKLADRMSKIVELQNEIGSKKQKLSIGEKIGALFNLKSTDNLKEIADKKKEISNLNRKIVNRVVKLNNFAGKNNAPDVISIGNNAKTNIKTLTGDMLIYAQDVIGKYSKSAANVKDSKTLIDSVHNKSRYGRMLMIASSLISTGIFLALTPKMYQLSKTYPGVVGLEGGKKSDEPAKNTVKEGK